MDVERLVDQAVGLVVSYCKRIAGRAGADLSDAVAEQLYGIVERQLAGDEPGDAVLAGVREEPEDEHRVRDLAGVLLDAFREDAAFAAEVEERIDRARQSGRLDQRAVTQAHVTVGKMHRSHFSLGPMTITNTRQVRIAFGGIGIAALVGLLILFGNLLSTRDEPTLSDADSEEVPDSQGDPGGTTAPADSDPRSETITAGELSEEGNVLVIDDDGFHPNTIVVQDSNCDFGCSVVFDAVNEGTTSHSFTIDDSHFDQGWLESYGSVDWELAPGETAGGIYVTSLPGSSDDLNPEVLEFYCRFHPTLRGQFVHEG